MLGYILIAAALLLGLLTGSSLLQVAGYFAEGLLAWSTLQLLGVVTLIEMLTVFLQGTGSLERMLAALRRVFQDSRVLIALVPSVMGLFPVPGGAILSAPMVEKYGGEIGFGANTKAAVNLFFRHIWDQVFPFKPHLILAAAVLNIPLFTLIGWHLPVTVATMLLGYWYLVGRNPRPRVPHEGNGVDLGVGRPLWVEVAPLLIPLVLALLLGIDFLFAMAAGLLFGLATQRISRGMLEKIVAKGVRPRLLFTLASVMVFKTVVEHSGLVRETAVLFTGMGIPLVLLTVALPLAVGVATGLEMAVVAMAFPLLVGMVPAGTPALPYILVMMVANAVGATLSPAHICMAAGNEYYGASLGRVVWLNLPPMLFRLVATLLFAWALAIYWLP